MVRRLLILALLASASWLPSAWAQVPAGGEFRVNTYTTTDQLRQSLAADAAGNFVAAWESANQDGSGHGIFAQRYDASGAPRGAEFRVNGYTTGFQGDPSLAADAAGNFVVAWRSRDQDGSGSGIFGQRYDASGAPGGPEFQVNGHTIGGQYDPSLAADAAGNFVIAWESADQDGSAFGIFGQRYDASGAPRGGEFRVNSSTTGGQYDPSLAADAAGNFVVAWESANQVGSAYDIFGQRYDASGAPRGAEFRVNTYITGNQYGPSLATDAAGNLVVAWMSVGLDGSAYGIFGQRYDASGAPRGGEFRVNSDATGEQYDPSLAADAAGNFVIAWTSPGQDGSGAGTFGRRYDASGVPRGAEFRANTFTTGDQWTPAAASDATGNLLVAWYSANQDGSVFGIFGQRYGGLLPSGLALDRIATAGADGNGVLEPGETAAAVEPSWRNVNGASQSFGGVGLSFSGPAAAGVAYSLPEASASYGTVADGAAAPCTDCYAVSVGFGGTRPSTHWDATFSERITPDAMGQQKLWLIHVGQSFADVPKASPFYRFVEALLHRGVTGGCSATAYCPASAVTREQVAVFALAGKEGAGYLPPACGTPVFGDVPASSPFCRYVEELARRGVVSGCGGGNYCPTSAVTREQMPVFVLRVLDPTLDPPACGTPVFADVPASSPFCRFIEELARRGVVSGCGGGNYCPSDPVSREQMAVFISATFGLTLYGL